MLSSRTHENVVVEPLVIHQAHLLAQLVVLACGAAWFGDPFWLAVSFLLSRFLQLRKFQLGLVSGIGLFRQLSCMKVCGVMELSVTFDGLSYLSSLLVLTAPRACLWMRLGQCRETSKKTGPTATCMTYQAGMPLHRCPRPFAWNYSLASLRRLAAVTQGAKESRVERQ